MTNSDALIPAFQLDRVLNQDQAGRRTCLYGTIHGQPALMTLERAPFPTSSTLLTHTLQTLTSLQSLGANDIFSWYLATTATASIPGLTVAQIPADVKINLIYPCTEQQIKKYSRQGVRTVIETPRIYTEAVKPYMQQKREKGNLNWVWNIIEGKTEVADVIYRTPLGHNEEEGFLLLPDLNWDRRTIESLHLLGVVERRDIWSLRDLKKKHIPWLRVMKEKLVQATVGAYKDLESDQLKLYALPKQWVKQ
ncbi:hypothetical protein K3495_g9050 [Podosphaera aphanis]|nr:hypothetical protein K3495_g9050 [Podosphaera aphanis]